MSLFRAKLPLKWSAMRYAVREMWRDRYLRWEAGRERFRQDLLDESKQYACTRLLEEALHLDGDIAECGVYRGHTLLRIAATAARCAPDKTILGFDSFGGFPSGSVQQIDVGSGRRLKRVQNKFQYAQGAVRRLNKISKLFDFNVELVPGFFENTLSQYRDRRFCFVHLDCDIYESYKTCLNELYDRIVPGGVIVFDEYNHPVWPGASRAIDEFFTDREEKPEYRHGINQGNFFVRRPAASLESAADHRGAGFAA